MRIFQLLDQSTNLSLPQNQTWRRNLYEPLVEMGHDVVLLSTELGKQAMRQNNSQLQTRFGEQVLSAFQAAAKKQPVDLFFSYLMDGMIDPAILTEIHRSGVPMVNFSCNNIHQFDLVDGISRYFDLNLYAEKQAGIKFQKIRANSLWWPMASNPRYFHPMQLPREVDVSFVGGNYALRAEYILHLLQSGVDVQVYGPRWRLDAEKPWKTPLRHVYYQLRRWLASGKQAQKSETMRLQHYQQHIFLDRAYRSHLHAPIPDEELIALYSRSRISLGFLEVYDSHDPGKSVLQHLHLREFEAPMCGALYLTGYSEELAEMFEPGKEVLTYQSKAEMLDKVRYYLSNPAEGESIRKAGHRRALAEHTYQQRFRTLFHVLGLEKNAQN